MKQASDINTRREQLLKELQPAVKLVATWPEWKKNILGPIRPPMPPSKQQKS